MKLGYLKRPTSHKTMLAYLWMSTIDQILVGPHLTCTVDSVDSASASVDVTRSEYVLHFNQMQETGCWFEPITMAAESVFSGLRMLLLSLPWILYIIIPPLSSAAPSAAHDGHTHPALQPGDFASIPEGIVEPQPSTRSPIASAAQGEEIPFDPHPVVAGREGRPSRRVRDEFYRPKRTVVGGDVHPSPQTADLEDLVENLKTQLKESQAAQVHTRSVSSQVTSPASVHLSFSSMSLY